MRDNYFLDTNILIYAVGNLAEKKERAIDLICPDAWISPQVLGESITVMSRKLGYTSQQIRAIIEQFLHAMPIEPLTEDTVHAALTLMKRYGYTYYDSQILASALQAACPIVYSEDLQHGQLIDGCLRIVNPFLKDEKRHS